MVRAVRPTLAGCVVVLSLLAGACGKEGPPLAPLHLVPSAPTGLTARRVEDRVRLTFTLPTTNANGPGRLELDHIDVYAITVGPGVTPPNRDLLSKTYLVGQIAVRPAPVEGEPPVEGDTRPGPGEAVTFDDTLTEAVLTPIVLKSTQPAAAAPGAAAKPGTEGPPADPQAAAGTAPVLPGQAAGATVPAPATATEPAAKVPAAEPVTKDPAAKDPTTKDPATKEPGQVPDPGAAKDPAAAQPPDATGKPKPPPAAAIPAAPVSKDPVRVYVLRGVTRRGRFGPPSTRVNLAIVPPPAPPVGVVAAFDGAAIALAWKPPPDGPAPSGYAVYKSGETLQPVSSTLVTAGSFEQPAAASLEPQCFRVRSVNVVAAVLIEGPLSEEACVTPRDVFAPAAPAGLQAVATTGQISLIWDANTEKDVAGYLVLRGEAGAAELQAITPTPIRETSYRDTTVKPGVRYVYTVVAVDTAAPPNVSPQAERREETAR
jgi:hypothetical protein